MNYSIDQVKRAIKSKMPSESDQGQEGQSLSAVLSFQYFLNLIKGIENMKGNLKMKIRLLGSPHFIEVCLACLELEDTINA